jgi:molybdopterin synthase sulfur carrier subunit
VAVTLLYFASLREAVGLSREELAFEAGATIGTVVDFLRARSVRWADALAPGKTWRVAVNQQMASLATPVNPGDEVAFFPPVTGG